MTEDPIVRVLARECGRCSGKGTERHQLDRDLAAGYGEHRCPSCLGTGQGFAHRTPGEAAAALRRYFASEEVRERFMEAVEDDTLGCADLLAALHLTEEKSKHEQ